MAKRGLFPGTFDPVTLGHINIMERGLRVFDELVIAVADQHRKNPIFDAKSRIDMIRHSLPDGIKNQIQIEVFRELQVEFARKKGITIIIRGLRVLSDFEYEFQIASMNQRLAPELETIFLAPQPRYSFITSTMVKEVARYGGDLTGLVSPYVAKRLQEYYGIAFGDKIKRKDS
ncbi:MAG: pantetheine-phosphate adenylyltransferase [Candidatus Eisenbacteria bacterium]|uniref:Phosphopantetheine adenylyltransferase n=1 Tax=Eiseniibacteriota bacterium TaxID=2212470 RepID=A0A948W4Q2_UNCEI|nr:pantetheine-phosphate adenylyltransferase [Candidatus Eisenbacteria bacterium]MBU1947352.1 pantetheine-phosphate adenylyltransferase [Candidatus Eisenbacteria bacterium]MBU2692467.1 pantetheine-phosphate adenylyltransferase [Candidatus Eisenbacteria bacterium]